MAAVKFAIVLFVKNEVRDLSSWLAWHVTVGCSTFIIYDDRSTDGTWDLINRAAQRVDIRAFRTDPDVATFEERQRRSYRDAIERYRDEIEWLFFIDSDEYLFLDHQQSVSQLVDSLPGADGIAIHWCNYGSSGHALRPQQPVVEAFTRHSLPTNPINRHVKSMVRTNRVGPRFINVHCFDVAPERYLDPIGRPVDWSPVTGITAGDPDWRGAKLMHFQCRSMEHFIERLKMRPDIPAMTNTWHEYDMNDVEDVRFRSLLPAFHRNYQIITGLTDEEIMRTLKKEFARSIPFPRPRPRLDGPLKPYLLRTVHGTFLADAGDGDAAGHRPADDFTTGHALPILFAIPTDAEMHDANWGILMLPRPGGWLRGDPRRGPFLALRIDGRDGSLVTLTAPADNAVLNAGSGSEDLRFDRSRADEGERFTLVPLDAPELDGVPPPGHWPITLPPTPRSIGDRAAFVDWVRATPPENAAPTFDMLVRAMKRADRARIGDDHGIALRD